MGAVVLDSPWAGQTFSPPTPLDIATIENAIVAQLGANITAIEVVHFPAKPEDYRMTHRVGAALVRYDGAEYGRLMDTAAIVQERTLRFEITLMMRDLGWNYGGGADGVSPGAYAMVEAVRAALTGYRVPGCAKCYPLRERFVERDKQGGVWVYAIIFAMKTAAVEPSTPDNFPLLTLATAQEKGGITTVSVGVAPYTFSVSGSLQLAHGNVIAIVVTDPATGAEYAAATEYTLDTVNGVIGWVSGGTIPQGATVNAAYSYAESAGAEADGDSAPLAPHN